MRVSPVPKCLPVVPPRTSPLSYQQDRERKQSELEEKAREGLGNSWNPLGHFDPTSPPIVLHNNTEDGWSNQRFDLSKSIEQFRRLAVKASFIHQNNVALPTWFTLHSREPSPSTSKEVIMTSLNKSIAMLEEPLFLPEEYKVAYDIQTVTGLLGGGLELRRGGTSTGGSAFERACSFSDQWIVANIGKSVPYPSVRIGEVDLRSGFNRDYLSAFKRNDQRIDRKGYLNIGTADSLAKLDHPAWACALNIAIKSNQYFDFPMTLDKSTGEQHHVRFRARTMPDKYQLVALVRPQYVERVDYNFSTRLIDIEPLVINIGEFAAGFPMTQSILERSFVSSLDAVIDLGVGFDYDCDNCVASYLTYDPMSYERLHLALVGVCKDCSDGGVQRLRSFDSVTPVPW